MDYILARNKFAVGNQDSAVPATELEELKFCLVQADSANRHAIPVQDKNIRRPDYFLAHEKFAPEHSTLGNLDFAVQPN